MFLRLTEKTNPPGSDPKRILVNTDGLLIATPIFQGTRLSMASVRTPHIEVNESVVEIDQRLEEIARNEWPD